MLFACILEVADEASTSTAAHYEQERSKLKELNEKYEDEVRELRSKLSQEKEWVSYCWKHYCPGGDFCVACTRSVGRHIGITFAVLRRSSSSSRRRRMSHFFW